MMNNLTDLPPPFPNQCTNYEVLGNEKMLMTRCEGEDNRGNVELSELVDFSQLSFVFEDDYETIHVSGKIVVKKDLAPPIKVHIEIYRWTRDEWVPTAVSLKRDDFCRALVNPFEPWHLFLVNQIPKEERICPPEAGVSWDQVKNRVFIIIISLFLFLSLSPSLSLFSTFTRFRISQTVYS